MSIAEFSKGIRDHALKAFRTADIGQNKEINPLFYAGVTEGSIRTHEQEQNRTNFVIGRNTIEKIRNILIDEFPNLPSTTELFQRAQVVNNAYVKHTPKVSSVKSSDGSLDTAVVYEQIEFGNGIDAVLKEIFDTGNEGKNTIIRNQLVGTSGVFQKGHVVGVATNLLDKSMSKGATSITDPNVNAAVSAINLMIEDLRNFDFASSNYGTESAYNMLGSYTKTPNQYLVELQITKTNRDSGSKVGRDLKVLRSILTKDSESIKVNLVKKMNEDTLFVQSLINMKGSPSMLQLIEASVLEALDPKRHPATQKKFNAEGVNIAKFTRKINVNKDKLRESLQKEIAKLEQAKVRLIRDVKKKTRDTRGQFFSLTNLQILLQARLGAQIKENMGTGDRKDILNLRTGRFAESVEINRVSLQRDNAIAVFYSYMKNPYSTFEPGGRQGIPTSRDPVILINKSIRDIATEMVSNKLRMFRE